MTGLLGYGAAAEGMNDADVLILLGTDFPYDQFLPDTPTIMQYTPVSASSTPPSYSAAPRLEVSR